jgi:hypothetical protein
MSDVYKSVDENNIGPKRLDTPLRVRTTLTMFQNDDLTIGYKRPVGSCAMQSWLFVALARVDGTGTVTTRQTKTLNAFVLWVSMTMT